MITVSTAREMGESRALSLALDVLRSGGVIAAPTETVYGLMTCWNHAAGRERIFRLKHRPAEKHLQMLAASLEAAEAHGYCVDETVRRLARAFWPGPLTVVAAARDGGSIGLRLPRHGFLQRLLGELDIPLAATSANRSGDAPACTAEAAVHGLDGTPDLLVDGGDVRAFGGDASTVLSVVARPFRLLRSGPIDSERLAAVVGCVLAEGS